MVTISFYFLPNNPRRESGRKDVNKRRGHPRVPWVSLGQNGQNGFQDQIRAKNCHQKHYERQIQRDPDLRPRTPTQNDPPPKGQPELGEVLQDLPRRALHKKRGSLQISPQRNLRPSDVQNLQPLTSPACDLRFLVKEDYVTFLP